MDYDEKTAITSITIHEKGHIVVCKEDRVLRDGVVIARTPRSHEYAPGDDIAAEDAAVAQIAAVAWTPDVLAARKAFIANELKKADQIALAAQEARAKRESSP